MPNKQSDSPGVQPPAESEVKTERPLEFAPPGAVEWSSQDKHPEEWRPSDSPQSPTRVGAGEEWTAPERNAPPEPEREQPEPQRGEPSEEPGRRQE